MENLKIAYISNGAFSDVDISYLMEARKIMDITYYIVINPYGMKSCAYDFTKDELKEGVNIGRKVKSLQRFNSVLDLDNTFVVYSSSTHGYNIRSIKVKYSLFCHLRKRRFDLINTTLAPSYNNPFIFTLRKKLVFSVHDPIPHSSQNIKKVDKNRKLAMRLLKNFIIFNKAQKDEFIQHYNLQDKNVYVSALSCYDYLKMFSQDKAVSEEYLLYFGNITSYKGLEYLFPAMIMAHENGVNLNLVVAGKGNYYFDISDYKNKPYIKIYNNFIPDDELARLIQGSKFIVLPYIDATQSGVVMSAYAFNKPCIATNVGGLPEMVLDGKYGIICEPKDLKSLSTAIEYMYNNKKFLDQCSENINCDYHEDGIKSWRHISRNMLNIYKSIKES